MKASLKKYVAHVPALRSSLLFLRRMWKMRGAWLAVFMDIQQTYAETRFLREHIAPSSGNTLLIFALDDDLIYTLKLFGVMAAALRLKGWNVKIIFRNRSALWGIAYLRAFGISNFLFLEDAKLTKEEHAYCREVTQIFLRQKMDIQTIKSWSFEGSWIGPQIISTLSRLKFQGLPDFNDPAIFTLLSGVLPTTLENVLRARKFMTNHPAQLALTNEANYASFGPLVDMTILKGVDVIQMVQPWNDDALILRRLTAHSRREHPSSVSRESLDRMVKMPWSEDKEQALAQLFTDRYGGKWFLQARNQKDTKPYTRDELMRLFGLDPAKKIAVVFSHVLWDANLFYGDDLFRDYGDWFVQTVKAACTNDKVNWLIKLHPANVWKRAYENITSEYAEMALIRQHIGELPAHVKLVHADSDVSTLSLFEHIDCGITVRGTSGMELVCFGKPCITAGTGRYSGLGFTEDCASREEYLEQLANIDTLPPLDDARRLRAKWHAYAAFILRPWQIKCMKTLFAYKNKGSHPLDHNLRVLTKSRIDFEHSEDINAWVFWAEGKDIDYISGQDI
jgi:hypothetical protein